MNSQTITITKDDQRAILRGVVTKSWLVIGLVGTCGVIVFGIAALSFSAPSRQFPSHAVSAIFVLTLLCGLMVFNSARQIRMSLPVGTEHTVTVTSETLNLEGPGGASQIRWEQLSRLKQAKGAVFVHIKRTPIAFPGRLVTPEMFAEIADRISGESGSPQSLSDNT